MYDIIKIDDVRSKKSIIPTLEGKLRYYLIIRILKKLKIINLHIQFELYKFIFKKLIYSVLQSNLYYINTFLRIERKQKMYSREFKKCESMGCIMRYLLISLFALLICLFYFTAYYHPK